MFHSLDFLGLLSSYKRIFHKSILCIPGNNYLRLTTLRVHLNWVSVNILTTTISSGADSHFLKIYHLFTSLKQLTSQMVTCMTLNQHTITKINQGHACSHELIKHGDNRHLLDTHDDTVDKIIILITMGKYAFVIMTKIETTT